MTKHSTHQNRKPVAQMLILPIRFSLGPHQVLVLLCLWLSSPLFNSEHLNWNLLQIRGFFVDAGDAFILLNDFKGNISGYGGYSSWNSNFECNDWSGIRCDNSSGRVFEISLSQSSLIGSIPESLGKLTNLTLLDLSNNLLSGSIPISLGNLRNLTILDLSSNSLTGSIPETFGSSASIIGLDLSRNSLTGSIPNSLGNLQNIILLDVSNNSLTGSIPGAFGNFASLISLDLSQNSLTGSIPNSLGNLQNMILLNSSSNSLTGSIPETFGNLTSLLILDLSQNSLSGSIPMTLSGLTRNLIPDARISMILASLTSIQDVSEVQVSVSQLQGVSMELMNSSRLTVLDLSNNTLTGRIPESLVTSLIELNLESNFFIGKVPAFNASTRFNCFNDSAFQRPEPECAPFCNPYQPWGPCTGHGVCVVLSSGDASCSCEAGLPYIDSPEYMCGNRVSTGNANFLLNDFKSSISNNANLNATFDTWDRTTVCETWSGVECDSNGEVIVLDVSSDLLTGSIPDALANLTRLTKLNLSNNSLTGNIPGSLEKLTSLTELNLSNNSLTGNIPESLGKLTSLTELDLSSNSLMGSIPESLGNLTNLTILNLSFNNLSGSIPAFIVELPNFTLTGNNFNSSTSNGFLATNNGFPIYAILIIVFGLSGIIIVAFILWFTQRCWLSGLHLDRQSSFDKRIQANFVKHVPLAIVQIASENFSPDKILGEGGYGVVYKGESPNGGIWAIKRAKLVSKQSLIDFQNEIDVISRISHVNILSLRAYCSQGGEQILIYDYMTNGSLKSRLQLNDTSATPPLTFKQRLVIVMGAAEGLKYLHHLAQPTIIHRDVKSDNILLNEKLQALVADFGLLKDNEPVDSKQLITQRLIGTPGYMDPEYWNTQVTTKSDVYSFGVVLFEIITGKGPIVIYDLSHEMNVHNCFSLASLVLELNNIEGVWLVDPLLKEKYSNRAMRALCELAKSCVSQKAVDRPSMEEVVVQLAHIKEMADHADENSLPSIFVHSWDLSNIVGRSTIEIDNVTWQQSFSQDKQAFTASVRYR